MKRVESFSAGRIVLIGAFALLLATIVLGFLAIAKMDRESKAEEEFLADTTLDQSSSMNRVLIAAVRLSEALHYHEGRSIQTAIELGRLLVSHAHIPPFVSEGTFRRFIKDDPLLIGMQLREAEDSYRAGLSAVEGDLAALEGAAGTAAETAAVDRFHGDFLSFVRALETRSRVMTQLEGTYHAQLRANQGEARANISLIILMQGLAAPLAILMAFLSMRAQNKHIKILSGLIPICAKCKKVRDDEGYWTQVETYVRDRSEAEFTHGICPECAKELYPEFSARKDAADPDPAKP